MTHYKYIADIILEELNTQIVIPCINESGMRSLLIKNSSNKRILSSYNTKNLLIKRNSVLNHGNTEYFFHTISCRNSSDFMNRNFDIIYDYLFKKIDKPIDEYEFSELLNSIEELFTKGTTDLNNLQVGVVGELLTLMYFVNNGYYDVLNRYHKNAFSKHDIELDSVKKIEIKTTAKENRIHRFSHHQLFESGYKIFVASVIIRHVENGMSLYKLFKQVMSHIDNYETHFFINKMMNYCAVDEYNQGILFSYEASYNSILLFRAQDIPHISDTIPKGVSNLNYDSVCDLSPSIDIHELMSAL